MGDDCDFDKDNDGLIDSIVSILVFVCSIIIVCGIPNYMDFLCKGEPPI